MSWYMKFVLLRLIVIVGLISASVGAEPSARGMQPPPDGHFKGIPRDIDFLKNQGWSQVIIQGKSPMGELISQTKNDGIQSILLVALSTKSEVVVEFVDNKANSKKLTSVSLSVKAKDEQGQVFDLSFAEKDNYCRATVYDQSKKVNVWTNSPRMQGILETAVRQAIPVQEFTFDDKTREITRGKVNVDVRK